MRWTAERLQALVEDGISESPSLEFKSELPLQTRSEKAEALKDLSGMANGGGGTVIYGVAEAEADWPVASGLPGLSDLGLQGSLENIVRAGIRPPLAADYVPVRMGDRYALAVDVEPSDLGPYMVEGYSKHQYFRRLGRSTAPMSEIEVRDAYWAAANRQSAREHVWEEHHLPLQSPTGDPWLMVSGLPAGALPELIDIRSVEDDSFKPPSAGDMYLRNWWLADLLPCIDELTRWADGYFAEERDPLRDLGRVIRIHRDGAIAIGVQLAAPGDENPLSVVRVSRVLNGVLWYLGWVWQTFDLARSVEVRIRLRRCDAVEFDLDHGTHIRRLVRPSGTTFDAVDLQQAVSPSALGRASTRHQLVQRFSDRVHQTFASSRARYPFQAGALFGSDGQPLGIGVTTEGVWTGPHDYLGTVHADGCITAASTGRPAAQWHHGVLLDLEGMTLGVLELAPGEGCPDEFIAISVDIDPSGGTQSRSHGVPESPPAHTPLAKPVGRWSTAGALERLRSI